MSETQNTLKPVLDKPLQLDINIPNFEGKAGKDGRNGRDGDDAYRIAVRNGFSGTEKEWLETLKGTQDIEIPQQILSALPLDYTKDFAGVIGFLIDNIIDNINANIPLRVMTVKNTSVYRGGNNLITFDALPSNCIVTLTMGKFTETKQRINGSEIQFTVNPKEDDETVGLRCYTVGGYPIELATLSVLNAADKALENYDPSANWTNVLTINKDNWNTISEITNENVVIDMDSSIDWSHIGRRLRNAQQNVMIKNANNDVFDFVPSSLNKNANVYLYSFDEDSIELNNFVISTTSFASRVKNNFYMNYDKYPNLKKALLDAVIFDTIKNINGTRALIQDTTTGDTKEIFL